MNNDSDSASHWEYVDFDLEIGEQTESRRYPISVHSPEGEAREEMRFPFDEWELKDQLRDVEFALLRSGGTRRRIGTPEEQTIQGFGRALFEALLVGEVGTQYRVSWREARRQNKGLRVKLHVRPPELSSLPWEFVYDPQHSYLGLSSRTPLVRYPDVPHPIERLRVTPPLRILGMVASPLGLPQLDMGHEKRLVEEAIRALQGRGLLELTWLEGQTWRDLQRAMRRGPWHVLHFIGHGGFDPETEEGAIALSDEVGRQHLLGASDLALLLDDHYFLRLVFLNSCEGARGSPRDAFSSTAATLVRAGIPAVVAMQYEITDRAAIEFSRTFYDAVADRLPIDAAVAEARTAVKMGSALEWGTPVLYMRSEDGLIFDIPPEERHTEPAEPTEEGEDQEGLLRRYREGVESAWAGGELDVPRAERLRNLADELGLTSSSVANLEREVMGDTVEAILERYEQAAREEDHRNRLDELYGRARGLHRDQEWQAVVGLFAEIHAEDPDYPDPEGLLQSAREALERIRKEQDTIRRYREVVESVWVDEKLDGGEVETLRDLADKLQLGPSQTGQIEREVIGDTKEALLEGQERAAKERYRRAVGGAWIDNKVTAAEADGLGALRSELGLSTNVAADIEREVTGDTVQAILQRQTREGEEHQRHLEELYAKARRLHVDREWQAVVNVFEQIHAAEPGYPDPEDLLTSANKALEGAQIEATEEEPYATEAAKRKGKELGMDLSLLKGSGASGRIVLKDVVSAANQRNVAISRPIQEDILADRIQEPPVTIITASNATKVASLRTLRGHKKSVEAVAFSSDGRLLASGSGGLFGRSDDTVRLWRVEKGELPSRELPRILKGHTRALSSVAFSPDSELLASGSRDHTVRLWRVESGELLHTLEGHTDLVESVAFSPDGELLASGSYDKTVRLWQVESGELLRSLVEHTKGLRSVAFSPDGELLVSGSEDGTVRLWQVESGELLRTLGDTNAVNYVLSVAFSPDGELLALGSSDKWVRLWQVESGELLRSLEGHKNGSRSVAFSPDGQLLAAVSGGIIDRTEDVVWLWRVESAELLCTLEGHTQSVTSVAFSPDGELLASGSEDKTVRLWGVR